MREIIALESIPITAYFITGATKEYGEIKYTYEEEQISGVFQPAGSVSKMGRVYNEIDGEWRLFTFSNYVLRPEYMIKVYEQYYKVYEVKDWSQYGYIEYKLNLATIEDTRNLYDFLDKANSENTCGL